MTSVSNDSSPEPATPGSLPFGAGRVIEARIERPAHGGHFVARIDGRVVFVRHALPGETVRVRLTEQADDASFWRGDAVEVLEPSPHRTAHPWPLADSLKSAVRGRAPVGGAEFGHIALAEQRRIKGGIFAEQLRRLAGVERLMEVEAVPTESPDGLGWRTRTAFAVTGSGRLAMHVHRSNDLVATASMPLAVDAINALELWKIDFSGMDRVDVAAGSAGGMPLVLLVPAAGSPARRPSAIAAQLKGASVAVLDVESGGVQRLTGRTWLQERVGDHEFRVTGAGFWQIHRGAPSVLVDAVLAGLGVAPGEKVADLYAGAGLFTVPLAAIVGSGGSILSVEGSSGTSKDARRNLHGQDHVVIVEGRVESVLDSWEAPLDVVLLDPPRAGAGKHVVTQIIKARPRAVGYVSCDPASFARDLGLFLAHGWSLDQVRVFDLYPHTHHMESFAVLTPPAGDPPLPARDSMAPTSAPER